MLDTRAQAPIERRDDTWRVCVCLCVMCVCVCVCVCVTLSPSTMEGMYATAPKDGSTHHMNSEAVMLTILSCRAEWGSNGHKTHIHVSI